MMRTCLLFMGLVLEVQGAADAADDVCPAQGCGKRTAPKSPYYWPNANGPYPIRSRSPYVGVRNLSAARSWGYRPPGPSQCSIGGVLIDDEKNIYAQFAAGLHKFTSNGDLVWREDILKAGSADAYAIWNGAIYGNHWSGHIFALDMHDGHELWRTNICDAAGPIAPQHRHTHYSCEGIGNDNGAIAIHDDGIVVCKTHGSSQQGASMHVSAFNATDGGFLWTFAADSVLWNVAPQFTDDGKSVIFQDMSARVYRVDMDTGNLIWKAGDKDRNPWDNFIGAQPAIGNGLVYGMRSFGNGGARAYDPTPVGKIYAYRLSDGKKVWVSEDLPDVPYNVPVIAPVGRNGEMLLISAVGSPCCVDHVVLNLFPDSAVIGDVRSELLVLPKIMGGLSAILGAETVYWLFHHLTVALGDWQYLLWGNPIWRNQLWFLNADTGEKRWVYHFPPWYKGGARNGEEQAIKDRANQGSYGEPSFCFPSLDAAGNLYTCNVDGFFRVLADTDGDGVWELQSQFDGLSGQTTPGPAIAPGMLAIMNNEWLWVFNADD